MSGAGADALRLAHLETAAYKDKLHQARRQQRIMDGLPDRRIDYRPPAPPTPAAAQCLECARPAVREGLCSRHLVLEGLA